MESGMESSVKVDVKILLSTIVVYILVVSIRPILIIAVGRFGRMIFKINFSISMFNRSEQKLTVFVALHNIILNMSNFFIPFVVVLRL